MKDKIQNKFFTKNNNKINGNYDPDNYANELIKDFIDNYDVKLFDDLGIDNFNIKKDNNKQK